MRGLRNIIGGDLGRWGVSGTSHNPLYIIQPVMTILLFFKTRRWHLEKMTIHSSAHNWWSRERSDPVLRSLNTYAC